MKSIYSGTSIIRHSMGDEKNVGLSNNLHNPTFVENQQNVGL